MDLYRLVLAALDALPSVPRNLQVLETTGLVKQHYPSVSTDRAAFVGPLDQELLAPTCCKLLQAYPEEHPVTLIVHPGGEASSVDCTLDQARSLELDGGPSLLYVPPLPCPGTVESFYATVAHLRAPNGCPWDREQTHRSLRQGFQEEAHEVLDALDRGDLEALQEELGDVLLHILLQAQIATENGEFRLKDIVCRVNEKIVYRHPHVFGGLDVDGVDEVLVNWEALKQAEKGKKRAAPSALDGIALSMPALARAQSLQRHVHGTGVLEGDVDRLRERITASVGQLVQITDAVSRDRCLGELLFDLAQLSRKLGVDAESALREANVRFEDWYRAREARESEIDISTG